MELKGTDFEDWAIKVVDNLVKDLTDMLKIINDLKKRVEELESGK